MFNSVRNKVVLVTGASRGIGAAIAYRFASEGAKVFLTARTVSDGPKIPGSLMSVVERIESAGGVCSFFPADISVASDRELLVNECMSRFGGVDVLVNNAARAIFKSSVDQSLLNIESTLATNFVAPLHLSQLTVPSMIERGGGSILNISSVTSVLPPSAPYSSEQRHYRFHNTRSPSLYGSSKAALERLTVGLAIELSKYNVSVNSLAPVEAVASEGAIASGTIDAIAHYEPIEAMAEAALALCSAESALISGRVCLSLPLLQELGLRIKSLDGKSFI